MERKVLFLDIDGTLVDFHGEIPASAGRALKMAKQKGHLLVLCTGRTKVQVYPWLREYGFDGMITGAGAQVEAGDRLICRHLTDQKHLAEAVGFFERVRAPYYLQAETAIYAPQWCLDKRTAVFGGKVSEEERKKCFGTLIRDERPWLREDIEKIAYYQAPEPPEAVQKALGYYFKEEASTFQDINGTEREGPIREFVGIGRENTAAFGDGPNDFKMLEYAGVGVAMGNAGKELKAAADLVTSSIGEDGLYRAFEKLKLF